MTSANGKRNHTLATHRLSVSLTADQHAELSEIAEENRVSVAWVVREAIERFLIEERPLFHVRLKQ
ncbi:ribbon-helix-helix domain-containing protein [Marinobacter nauticus]|uniref:ribbon-helix-helix domain-containing protein n=1 Tax=Marinobacter nauticus TaxID=2743 RepID=UPI001C9A01FA|nr:ribbon-helix-helix domain-containing protein [Marinobacter nauticus]MBY5938920.1 ribbon-helix-helix domain-containing protein [Marinobacter nauticus]MBY5956149.1 ribbon-helix-helix domain-containing protein [Marinobacter nauticus]MBY6009940.1 ribbon-helix-helix domain-containing protein [Marinobacter nauticus]